MKFLKKIDKTEIVEKMTRAASKCGYKLKKASPTIMIVGAAIGGVTATVLACKATIKAQDIMTEHYAQVESIHTAKKQIESGEIQLSDGETYTEKDYKSDITTTYVQTGLKLAKVYAPAVTLGAVSLGCMFGSHHIMSKRNASLTAAYIALDKAFEEYKSPCIRPLWQPCTGGAGAQHQGCGAREQEHQRAGRGGDHQGVQGCRHAAHQPLYLHL